MDLNHCPPQRKLIAAALKWVGQAAARPKSSTSFGNGVWERMHGGGTSAYPFCRPKGLRGAPNQWEVKLVCDPDRKGEEVSLVDHFTIESEEQPDKEVVYAELEKRLKELLKYVEEPNEEGFHRGIVTIRSHYSFHIDDDENSYRRYNLGRGVRE
ncbi:hypothetical protein PHLGIDRAFT_17237 [Phlebiopsis gigantea 11061_1 CR5-6]|uniref:Uncharacterized protein n=1 Tax=Phlebiopsis gigantea (strain 11061_1 CR5-6) TaxID=745531 RepID=A0A0C3P9L8_PHLG1|nr:hypothetical protein PHLGIDRAFT_17237 [Phlebiopsis gigantea 11061_1 CR5-6]